MAFSCLCKVDDHYSFTPYWTPPFVSQLAHEDRCHLNGMAMEDGLPRYATAFNKGDKRQSWRENVTTTGILMDVHSNETICEGLPMPHSPRLYDGKLYLLLSATGELVTISKLVTWFTEARLANFLRLQLHKRNRFLVTAAAFMMAISNIKLNMFYRSLQ